MGFADSPSYAGNEGETVELRVVLSSVATTDITVDIMTQDAVPVSAEGKCRANTVKTKLTRYFYSFSYTIGSIPSLLSFSLSLALYPSPTSLSLYY